MSNINAIEFKKQQFKPIKDDIIASEMIFKERFTSGGLVLLNDDGKSTGIRPRWGKVYAVGPEQKDFSVGQWIYVAHGRWTRGFKIKDEDGEQTLRKIDPEEVLLVWEGEGRPPEDTISTAINVAQKSM
jgi:co-chaperonin GroES (HSP10)